MLVDVVRPASRVRLILGDKFLVLFVCVRRTRRPRGRVACREGFDVGLLDRIDLVFPGSSHATGILTTSDATSLRAASIAAAREFAS